MIRMRNVRALLAGCALFLVTAGSAAAADFTPGSSGLGDPFFPLGGNGGYDVGHYDLTLGVRPRHRTCSTARASITRDGDAGPVAVRSRPARLRRSRS